MSEVLTHASQLRATIFTHGIQSPSHSFTFPFKRPTNYLLLMSDAVQSTGGLEQDGQLDIWEMLHRTYSDGIDGAMLGWL
jgi:hypothetical protein